MEFFRTLKKELTKGDPLAPGAEEPPADLPQLVARLGSLGTMFAQVNEQVLANLAKRDTPSGGGVVLDEPLKNFLELLRQKLDDLGHDHHQLAEAIHRLEESLQTRLKEWIAAVPQSRAEATADGAAAAASSSAVAAPAERAAPAVKPAPPPADWQQAIFPAELTGAPGLESHRERFFEELLAGEPPACALAGQLLLFQSTSAERMAPLLKEIGEAYYRWQPKREPGSSPMEVALVQWLKRRCEAAGITNQVELVSPGERFDTLRHHAATRGVEITDVYGWVVVRDGGKIYTKALVAAR